MHRSRKTAGIVCLRITNAEPLVILQKLIDKGIDLFQVSQPDELTLLIEISAMDHRKTCIFLEQSGCEYEITKKAGLYWLVRSMSNRAFLIAGIVLVVLVTIILPTRILFVHVEGNESIPKSYIMECAQKCGITFGSSRRLVRSEKMKNKLLEAIPQLQWAGINTSGCVATIQVREKNISNTTTTTPYAICNIVAQRDGIIYSCTVEEGTQLCQVGQAVSKGQVLVSGYQDSGLLVKAQNVKAEIFGLTQRQIEAVCLCKHQIRQGKTDESVRFSVRIGKNIIKLYKDSGISDGTCVKMYSEEYISLPGGFALPAAVITERIINYEVSQAQDTDHSCFDWLQSYCGQYILQHMIAGQILYEYTSMDLSEDVCSLIGRYACVELIGKNKTEEIIEEYGKNK